MAGSTLEQADAASGVTPGSPSRRVAVVASWYPSSDDPVSGIFVRDQVTILARWLDVAVIAPAMITWRVIVARLRRRGRQAAVPPDEVLTLRPRVYVLPRAGRINRWNYRRVVARAFDELERTWRRPDLINAQVVLPAGDAAIRVGRTQRIPVVLTEHSSRMSMHLASSESRRATIEALRGADAVVAVGPGLRDEIVELADIPIEVVGNVIAPEFFEPSDRQRGPSSQLRLLAIGLLKPQKRFDVLLRSLRRVAEEHEDTTLTIVGDGPDRASLVSLARQLGIADRVNFAGLATRDSIRHWLTWADALVSSSDSESFGLAVAEALAVGIPVVVTASGGPETFVEPDMGIIVPKGDAAALTEALLRLPAFVRVFDRDTVRDRMASRFGPEAFASRLLPIFEQAIAARERSR
jgi:glycosyltransferase involved in cell wall biosynthesis